MATVDLSNYDLENAQDPIAVDEGEYKIRIIECDGVRENSAGNPYILPRFEIDGEPLAKDFTHYMALPTDDMDAKKSERTRASLKKFCLAFGLDFSTFDTDDLQGLEGWAILGKSYDDQYGEQNFIKRLQVGQ